MFRLCSRKAINSLLQIFIQNFNIYLTIVHKLNEKCLKLYSKLNRFVR